MRTFVYFSSTAKTSGKVLSGKNINLMSAGRMDIAIHVIINSFFLSHSIRNDVVLHLIFYGPPDPPKHIEMSIKPETNLSKKDVANLLKKILYKYKEGKKIEAVPGCYIEKKSFLEVIEELSKKNEIFIMDKNGENLRNIDIPKNSVFVIGDHLGLPKKELKRLKKISKKISVGPKVYFASHVVTLINNELDLRGF
ncbi:MAG: tRNA (pseudouridine(54)-N(1))-methyltransferase TrmY [Candidatus Pacearchaeota archaeon]|nr:MAG: tRNA (pseudouridine(54)-N(1))-methyltransferase TrmY [Candidatus Pacearchaeota archaeon]